jgi:hypothetical protein
MRFAFPVHWRALYGLWGFDHDCRILLGNNVNNGRDLNGWLNNRQGWRNADIQRLDIGGRQ